MGAPAPRAGNTLPRLAELARFSHHCHNDWGERPGGHGPKDHTAICLARKWFVHRTFRATTVRERSRDCRP